MYIEFKPGEKHASKEAAISDNHESFRDCGYLIDEDEVIIDIDCLDKSQIDELIKRFKISTQVVYTDRGVHLYYLKPDGYVRAKNGICQLGFKIESKTSTNTPRGITIKRNGTLRQIVNEGVRQRLPKMFTTSRKYDNLLGYEDGAGRNNQLFKYSNVLNAQKDRLQILRFINECVFAEPLSQDEFEIAIRGGGPRAITGTPELMIARDFIDRYKIKIYQQEMWWWNGKRYVKDSDGDSIKRNIALACENVIDKGKLSSAVDEVIKLIYLYAENMNGKEFYIALKNGCIYDHEFVPMDEPNLEFTPYYIDIAYKEDCEPVEIVDRYIDDITTPEVGEGEEKRSYRDTFIEALAYPLILDKGFIASIGKFFMLRGDGCNGKGTALNIMRKIYGAENCTSLSIAEMTDMRYLVTMAGKLVNLGDDIEPSAIDNKQMKMLKNITTCDTVSLRKLYKESYDDTITAKLFFTTNTDIRSYEKGYAYQRRVMWLPMFNKIEKPDRMFVAKMTSEKSLEYWLYLIMQGYQRLLSNRGFTDSPIIDEYNKEYHTMNNHMAVFVKTVDIDREIIGRTGVEIKKTYQEFNDDDGKKYKPGLLQQALQEFGIVQKPVYIKGRTYRVYVYQKWIDDGNNLANLVQKFRGDNE